MSLTHSAVVVVADDPAYPVGTDEWNADHVVSAANTQVLFSDSGSVAGDAGLTYNKTTNYLTNDGTGGDGGIYIKAGGSFPFYVEVSDGTEAFSLIPGTGSKGSIRALPHAPDIDGDALAAFGLFHIGDGGQQNFAFSSQALVAVKQSAKSTNTSSPQGVAIGVDTGTGSAAITALTGLIIEVDQTRTGGALTTARNINLLPIRKFDAGTITTAVALEIGDQTAAGTNYAIRTGAGLVQLGTLSASQVVQTDASKNLVSATIASIAVSALSGTANQITASASVGAVTLSLPSAVTLPGSMTLTTRTGTPATVAVFTSGGVLAEDAALDVALGGTNIASYAVGDLLSASGTTTLSKIAAPAQGQRLVSKGTGTLPAWIQLQTLAWAVMTAATTLTNMPAALTEGIPAIRTQFDFTEFTQVRLLGNCTTAGASGSNLRIQYSTDSGSSWNYFDSTGANSGPSITLTTTGVKDSGWITIDAGAKADVLMRFVSINGDGAADPVVAHIVLYAR